MNFRDQWAENDKGERFIFTVEMQRALKDAGLPVEPEALDDLPEGAVYESSPDTSSSSRSRDQQQGSSSETRESEEDLEFEAPATIQIDPMTGKYIGRMKWFNNKKGYGFIVRGGGEEIFFHKSGTTSDPNKLNEGQWVLYDVEETRKGPEAMEVEPYEGDTSELIS